jgi:AraC-like DNA-binding protein
MVKSGRPVNRRPIKEDQRKNVNDAIDIFRDKHNKTNLAAVASELKISTSTFHRFLNPESGVNDKMAIYICEQLGLNPTDILADIQIDIADEYNQPNKSQFAFLLKGNLRQGQESTFSIGLEHLHKVIDKSEFQQYVKDVYVSISGTFDCTSQVRSIMFLEELADLLENDNSKKLKIKSCALESG